MLIKEIVEYYYNSKIDTVKVSFRLKEDSEEYIREKCNLGMKSKKSKKNTEKYMPL